MHFEVTVYAYVYIFMGMMIDASGDWPVSWIATLFLDCGDCTEKFYIHTPSVLVEEVSKLRLGCRNL